MGGFTVDGCGASDRFYHLKNVGSFTCPKCGRESDFYLDEVKRKIDIFFIPTATISVKYAIMCGKCERGWYIGEVDKDKILSGRATVEISPDGVSFIQKDSFVNKSTEHIEREKNADKTTSLCPKCNYELQLNAKYCMNCGFDLSSKQDSVTTDINNTDSQNESIHDIELKKTDLNNTAKNDFSYALPEKKYCPKCNMFYVAQKEKCTICGGDLIKK